MDLLPEPDKYLTSAYDTERRFVSYWYQINEVLSVTHGNVLEVGIGNGFVSDYLRARGVKLTTVDIDGRLKPDVVANLTDLPFEASSFDVVACYEVLEHLPWETIPRAIAELNRVTASHSLVSLPDSERKYRVFIQFHRGSKAFRRVFVIPRIWKTKLECDGEHCWEIGVVGYPLCKINEEFERGNFEIEQTLIPFNNPYHRFFRLRKLEEDKGTPPRR